LSDRCRQAGAASGHYFWQDLWAAKYLFDNRRTHHVTIGSRIDGFVTHAIPFCNVTYVDIRPLSAIVEGLEYRPGSLLNLPFEDDSIQSMSSLHVIEHVGLGRYGDPVQADGHLQAAGELKRVLAPGGELLIGTPVGIERVCFDAHRIFDPQTVVSMFSPLGLVEFSLIDDQGDRIIRHQSFEVARKCKYGCGLFIFSK
jgi:SAM-dependent methyltransferase